MASGFLMNEVKITEKIDHVEGFTFDMIKNDPEKREEFEELWKEKMSKAGVDTSKMTILSITKGSYIVQAQVSLDAIHKVDPNKLGNAQIHPFFQQFSLSAENFDEKGDRTFSNECSQIDFRGGFPYYQPIKCKRFGIKVSGLYDKGNDDWLKMDGNPGEWAVTYHGVKSPDTNCTNTTSRLESILSGRKKG